MHPWFPLAVARSDWSRWRTAIATMPIAATIETKHGDVGLIHPGPATGVRPVCQGRFDGRDAADGTAPDLKH